MTLAMRSAALGLILLSIGCGSTTKPVDNGTSATSSPTDTTTGDAPTGTATATATGEPTGEAPTSKGPAAPDFTLPTLDGKNASLSDYKGKVVLIDFWSTTCDPCLVEMPHIVDIYNKNKDKGFIVLAVSLDGPDERSKVSQVVHQKKMTFPVLLDEETSVVARYNPKKEMPYSVLVDKSGAIVKSFPGYTPGNEKKLAQEIEALLK